MNRSRYTIALASRYRKAFSPSLPPQISSFSRWLAAPVNNRRCFATSNNNNSAIKDTFPKFPLESGRKFVMEAGKRAFQQMEWAVKNNLDKDAVLEANETALEVLKFVTECLSKNEFEVLEEKLSPEALEKARAIAIAQSSKSEDLVFEGVSTFFQSESRVFFPWVYSANNNSFSITYLACLINATRSSMWGMTLDIPRQEDGNFSEEFRVTDFYFETT